MKTSIKKGAFIITISSVIFLIGGYLGNIWLGRFLGPELYGIYGVVISLWTIITIILTSGLPQAVSRQVAMHESQAQEILGSAFLIQLVSAGIVTVLFFLLSDPIAFFFKDPNLSPYFKIAALIIPFYSIYSLYLNFYNGLHFFNKQAVMSSTYAISKLLFLVGLGYIFGLRGVFIGFLLAALVALGIGFQLPTKIRLSLLYRQLISFSVPLIGLALFSTLQQNIDLFLVKVLLGKDGLAGYYTATQNISIILVYTFSAFAVVLFPSISRNLSEQAHEKTQNLIQKSLRFVILLIIPSTLLISASSNALVNLIYSNAYMPAGSVLSILIFGYGCMTIYSLLVAILNGLGKPYMTLLISGFGCVISIVLCLLLIVKVGLIGAAIATSVSSMLMLTVAAVIVAHKIHHPYSFVSLTKITIASLIVYFLMWHLHPSGIMLPIAYGFLFLLYGLLLIAMKEITRNDLDYLYITMQLKLFPKK